MNLYVDRGQMFIPFWLGSEAATHARSLLGGPPPLGVVPGQIEAETRYLATLGLEENVDVSLFTTFDYKRRSSRFYFFHGTYKLQDQSSTLIQFVVHPTVLQRDDQSALTSELPATGFIFGTPAADPECKAVDSLSSQAIFEEHKTGGQPFFSQLEGDCAAAFDLQRNGYLHLLQMAFPSDQDAPINANWPFGESVFHVFAKKTRNIFEFRYIWA